MAGFDNDVLYANNVDFSGSFPVAGEITLDGELLIGSAVAPFIRPNRLTAGSNITITNGAGTIQISASGGASFTWSVVTSADNVKQIAVSNGYIAKGVSQVVFILPPTAAVGDTFTILGYANLWQLTQNAGQTIFFGAQQTTGGVGGSLTATMVRDRIEVVCVTANTEFDVVSSIGNITVI